MSRKIFLIAGRTGGPIMPLVAVAKELKNVEPIIIGVKNGFEEKVVAKQTNWKLETIPEAKLYFLSFSKKNLYDYITEFVKMVKSIFLLGYSFFKSIYFLLKHKPKLILGAGSFLSVPVISATRVTNFLRLTKVKIAIHQQDPIPGFSNKLTIKAADLKTCVYKKTKEYKNFEDCLVIPNPMDTKRFAKKEIESVLAEMKKEDSKLYNFIKNLSGKKPLFFIFGGGSGSRFINIWVAQNSKKLLEKFDVIHLKGALQEDYPLPEDNDHYIKLDTLSKEYPVVLKLADLVLCRAGMSTITELLYLQKPAILVPLFNSHQEQNVMQSKEWFKIFMQRKDEWPKWMERIEKIYPNEFKNIKYPDTKETEEKLKDYYQKVEDLIA